ncbi:oxidoreductase [Gammaproteobacteria bacterium 42_54_T18]|nr:oxidoreductase [Gammaproteobacteria bacterium 42_54_T18]
MSEQAPDLLFDLNLTEEQRIMRESLARFSEIEVASISRQADEAGQAPEGFYDKTAELGLSLLSIPEAYGGAGIPRSVLSNMLNAEDLGKGDMSLALGALTPLSFVNMLLDYGSEDQQEKYLTGIADETFKIATVALMEPRATFDATTSSTSTIETTAVLSGSGYVLNGEKSMVALAEDALHILVIARCDDDVGAFIVDKGTEGLTIEKEKFMGLRPLDLCRVVLNDVVINVDARLSGEAQPFDVQRLVDLGSIGLSAVVVGCCQAVVDYVVPYVNERVAFGEPISNRQSVAFMVADMATELEAMRLMVYRAASRAEQGLAFHKEAYLARILVAERAMEIGTNGVQLLGGHGFTREHPVELWYRNLRAMGILQGVAIV